MNAIEAVKVCFSSYATFSGRARRAEFWWFFLFQLLVSVGLSLGEEMLGLGAVASTVFALAIMVPALAVASRRIHDTDRSGWWLAPWYLVTAASTLGMLADVLGLPLTGFDPGAIGLVAVVGVLGLLFLIYFIVMLVLFAARGTAGPNRFGPDPLTGDRAAVFT